MCTSPLSAYLVSGCIPPLKRTRQANALAIADVALNSGPVVVQRLAPQGLQHVPVVEHALGLDLQPGGDGLEHAHRLDDAGHALAADERVGWESLARVLEGLGVELRVAR